MSNASDEAFSDPKIFEKYFDLRNCLDYILCCLTFCLTDSIGRNLTMIAYDQESTLSSGGVMDRKPMRFYPVFYDIDTAFGTNVQGGLYSTPYIEWPYDITGLYTAKEGAGQEYNCFGTLFLKRISKCYPKALSRRYQELKSGVNTFDPLQPVRSIVFKPLHSDISNVDTSIPKFGLPFKSNICKFVIEFNLAILTSLFCNPFNFVMIPQLYIRNIC